MTKNFKSLAWFLTGTICLVSLFFVANIAWAQDYGFNAVSNGLGGSLSVTDPRVIVGRIIQILLSFLGAIAVILIMYAGFLWMSSNGDEEKINKAKSILRNAVIGLVIILSSWGIATFIISRLSGAISGNIPGGELGGGGGVLINPGIGVFGACSVESAYPSPGQSGVPRNTSIFVTFKDDVKPETVCVNDAGDACACSDSCKWANPVNIRLFNTDLGDACGPTSCPAPNGNITELAVSLTGDNKSLVLTPTNYLGSVNGDTPYSVKFTEQVKKADGQSMFANCSSKFAQWDFIVSNAVDLVPPLVSPAGIFPLPDNEEDVFLQVVPATAAVGGIDVNSCPEVYSPAQLLEVNPATAQVILNYQGSLSSFQVAVPAGSPNKAQLFDGNGNLLGLADFNNEGQVVFANYFSLTAQNHPEGSRWEIAIVPEQLADTLVINSEVFTFATDSLFNNILVPDVCEVSVQAANIHAKLSGHPDIDLTRSENKLTVMARVAGAGGNNIVLQSSNTAALSIRPLTGGRNRQASSEARDKADRPMNSAIQVSFSEPINPITISGTASEVSNYIRVVNARATSSPAGAVCSVPSDCRSYKCENGSCVSDFLSGKFSVSNAYRTVEFISDKECGVNGCGEKIYCLPPNSHLAVELVAADLKTCNTDVDCLAYAPFRSCQETPRLYKTCQNIEGKNYPGANLGSLNGVIDAATNSFDGNRDTYADGPLNFYNDNLSPTANTGLKDKYKWSFYINNQISLEPPLITSITPVQGQLGASSTEPIKISFNTLMLNESLRSGTSVVTSGTSTQTHKLINLRSLSPTPLGYWIDNSNLDMPPFDGEPDITVANILHSVFNESLTYNAQVGSGVKNIYQNCYKPSAGPNCAASPLTPSCCFGSPTNSLGEDGNCR